MGRGHEISALGPLLGWSFFWRCLSLIDGRDPLYFPQRSAILDFEPANGDEETEWAKERGLTDLGTWLVLGGWVLLWTGYPGTVCLSTNPLSLSVWFLFRLWVQKFGFGSLLLDLGSWDSGQRHTQSLSAHGCLQL